MSQVLEKRLDLILLINQAKEISEVCEGKCAIPLHWENKYYCTMAKGFRDLTCKHLYNYSNFEHACLYEFKKDQVRSNN